VLITLVAASRLAFSLARDHEIPPLFARLSRKAQSPWVGAILTFVLSGILLPIGDLKILAELSSFVALLAFLAVNLTLVVLRFRLPDHERPFRVPIAVGRLPLIPLFAMATIVFLLAHFDRRVYAVGAVIIIAILIAFVVRRLSGSERERRGTTMDGGAE
jgi:basic amino acid/polyamine antiporter, APA family